MKKIGVILVIVMMFSLITSCSRVSTSGLEEDVLELVNKNLADMDNISATKVSLIHNEGNKYSGIIVFNVDGEEAMFDINVICDGRSFEYKIPELDR